MPKRHGSGSQITRTMYRSILQSSLKGILFVLLLVISSEAQAQMPPMPGSLDDSMVVNMDRSSDIKYVHMNISVTPDTEYVAGSVLLRALVVNATPFTTLSLRPQLTVDSVESENGDSLRFEHMGDRLLIELPKMMAPGEMYGVRVFYHGFSTEPDRKGIIHTTQDGGPTSPNITWTASEPYAAKNWWPVKDNPMDKIDSVDLWFTCDTAYQVASNGILMEVTKSGDTGHTYKWKHRYPIAHYLIAFSCTKYDTFTTYWKYNDTDSLPIQNFVYPGQIEKWRSALNVMPSILSTFSDWFGPYPFLNEKYGHAQWRGGGMENQTISFVNNTDTALLVHEAAHQWWGDAMTCLVWNELWLNEGFATYFTSRYFGKQLGDDVHFRDMAAKEKFITSQPGGSVFVPDSLLPNTSRVFDARLSYDKGAWVLHMLKYLIGDQNFSLGIKTLHITPEMYGNLSTPALEMHFSKLTTRNLKPFFRQWVFNEGYPVYQFGVQSVQMFGQWRVMLRLDQTPSVEGTEFFAMPIQVRMEGDGWDSMIVLENTFNGQTWDFFLDREPKRFVLDPFNTILDGRVEQYLSVEDKAKSSNVTLQPNPVKRGDQLRITLEQGLVLRGFEIVDTRGAVLITDSTIHSEPSVLVPMSSLGSGAYTVRLHLIDNQGNRFDANEKFIVE